MNHKPSPLVTIGIPVFNGANFLEQALVSASEQEDVDLEIVVVNNGSTDETAEILERFAQTEPRLRIHHGDVNRGAAWSFNKCVEMADGEYFRWAAHDDLFDSRFTRSCLDMLLENRHMSAVVTRAEMIDDNGDHVAPLEDFRGAASDDAIRRGADIMLDSRWCLHIFGLIPMRLLNETRLIQPFSSSDHITLFELAVRGPFGLVDERWFSNREHQDRSMRAHGELARDREAWFDPGRDGVYTLPKWRLFRAYCRGAYEYFGFGVDLLKFAPVAGRWMVNGHNRRILMYEVLGWVRHRIRRLAS
ncbi:MAG: glycosyltransferase [Actinomycetia bacterium]|nr:glycosyltransferase [Actinomycetes bacterium]MCP4960215.1 glycosyltransferase [Actinomycetes bacterium]